MPRKNAIQQQQQQEEEEWIGAAIGLVRSELCLACTGPVKHANLISCYVLSWGSLPEPNQAESSRGSSESWVGNKFRTFRFHKPSSTWLWQVLLLLAWINRQIKIT